MKIEILHVPDCPNLGLLDERLRQAISPAEVAYRVVADVDTAAATGMTGSPTLLLDGTDPFARPDLNPSLSCRLYPHDDGHVEGAPSVAALRQALAAHHGPEQCCAPSDGPSALRQARRRAAPADPVERAVHHAILHTFASTGGPPTTTDLNHLASPDTANTILRRLHDADVIRLDANGAIRVAYPFSATPTRHHIRLASGTEVHAMCAIDALGMPAMLDTDATITTHDPTTNAPITVTITNGQSTWDPPTTTAFVPATTGNGPSADTCCDHLNLFTNTTTAQSWTRSHPEVDGQLLTATEAEALGRQIFGTLLRNS
jgi:hypothetical protein